MAQPETDPFEQLRERIRSTADAAERLSFEAASEGGDPGERARRADETTEEARALVALVQLLRDLLPEELRQQVMDLVRQVLKLLRAVIDWYLARLEPGPDERQRQAPVVEDIPLD
jgi:flagellar biosynthesis/type III secretory pathway protein FliH